MRPQLLTARARVAPSNSATIKSALALALLVAQVFPSAAQTPAGRPATGSVAGRVTTADGKPSVGVAVVLLPREITPDR